MRIGFDAKRAFMNTSGLGSYSRNLLRGLMEQFPLQMYLLYTPGASKSIEVPSSVYSRAIRPVQVWRRGLRPIWRSYFLSTLAKKHKLDVYHGLSAELPFGIEKANCRSIVTIHDLIFKRYPHQYRRADVFTHNKKVKYACRVADVVVAISEQTKSDIVKFYDIPKERIQVIYQSCSPAFNLSHTEEERSFVRAKYNLADNYILYVGSITRRKNIIHLITAYARSGTSLPLVLVGNGKRYLNQVKKYIAAHQLTGQVKIITNVPDADLPALYQSAKLFIYPSIFEGFGIPILEAMQSGTPVITSTGSCFREVGGDAVMYANPNNGDELAAQIDRVLNNTTIQESMIQKGIEQSKKFHHQALSKQWMELYQAK